MLLQTTEIRKNILMGAGKRIDIIVLKWNWGELMGHHEGNSHVARVQLLRDAVVLRMSRFDRFFISQTR